MNIFFYFHAVEHKNTVLKIVFFNVFVRKDHWHQCFYFKLHLMYNKCINSSTLPNEIISILNQTEPCRRSLIAAHLWLALIKKTRLRKQFYCMESNQLKVAILSVMQG